MNKCLKITLIGVLKGEFVHQVVQRYARSHELEGYAQAVSLGKVKIIVCGKKEHVDSFVDILHKESHKEQMYDIEIEPFLKDKDYRGVFRVIE